MGPIRWPTEAAPGPARLAAALHAHAKAYDVDIINGQRVASLLGFAPALKADAVLPNTEWLRGTVELSRHGEIVIDERCATSVPGVYAAGDATTVPYKQIIVAGGEGAKAALSAFDHLMRMPAPLQAVPA